MLGKSSGISVRCALSVMEFVGKVNHAALEDIQRVSKLRHSLYQLQDTDSVTVFIIKRSGCADFLLYRKLQKESGCDKIEDENITA